MKNNIVSTALICVTILMAFAACEKDFDNPPKLTIPEGFLLDIEDLRQIAVDSVDYTFVDDYSIYVTVTADGASGNLFRQVYAQDDSSAISVRTVEPDGLYEGDYVRINLNGSLLTIDNGVVQIEDVDVNTKVVIQANNQFIAPVELTLAEALDSEEYLGFLIHLEEVEVADAEIGLTYATPETDPPTSENRHLQDCSVDANSIILRNSGYSDFANELMPSGKGSVTAILAEFNGDKQLFIRGKDDLAFSGPRCNGSSGVIIYQENFENYAPFSSLNEASDWTTYQSINSDVDWEIFQNDFVSAAKVTSFSGGSGSLAETWLISKSFDLSSFPTASFSFTNTKRYSGPDMKTFISVNHIDDADPASSTWVELDVDYDSDEGSWDLVPTNLIDLSDYLEANVHIAFYYIGGNGDTSTYEIDNVTIYE